MKAISSSFCNVRGLWVIKPSRVWARSMQSATYDAATGSPLPMQYGAVRVISCNHYLNMTLLVNSPSEQKLCYVMWNYWVVLIESALCCFAGIEHLEVFFVKYLIVFSTTLFTFSLARIYAIIAFLISECRFMIIMLAPYSAFDVDDYTPAPYSLFPI